VSSTLSRLTEVFQEIFDDGEIEVCRQTNATDIDAWDSLMHINLVLAAEREFDIRFSSSEVAQLHDVGELVDLIDAKAVNGD